MKKRKFLILNLLLLSVAVWSAKAVAQQPSPTPKKDTSAATQTNPEVGSYGNYTINSSIELGVRGLGIDGSRLKYYSDLNYRAGFRIFDSSFLMRSKSDKGTLLDTVLVTSNGFGSDPTGTFRINAEKNRLWKLDAQYRRNSYDNYIACCNLAQARAAGPNLGLGVTQNYTNAEHNMSDVDVKLFPTNRRFRLNFGFTIDRFSGPGGSSLSYARDDYAIKKDWETRSNEGRIGFEAKLGGLDLSFTQGYRAYGDNSFFFSGFNPGNNLTNFSLLNGFDRTMNYSGRAWYSRISAHTTIDKKVDITARYIYTKSRNKYSFEENAYGQGTLEGTDVFIDRNLIEALSNGVERPTHLFDIGFTWRVTDKLRISDTFRYNTFRIDGSFAYSDTRFLRRRTTGAPLLPYPVVLTVNPFRELDVRRWQNAIELDYDFGPRLSVFVGHRYIDREIEHTGLGEVYPLDTSSLATARNFLVEGAATNSTNGFFGGLKAKPVKWWTLYFDVNRGQTDNAFTRLDNYDVLNFRIRNRFTPRKGLNFTVSFIAKNNNNPGVADEALLGVPEFDVDISSRTFTSTVDWTPNSRYFIGGGYTYQHVTSDVGIIFVPSVAPARPLTGVSQYFMRNSFFYFNGGFQLHPRLSFYARYSINRDTGQGDRVTNDAAGLFIRSLPMRFQTPEVRMVLKINNRLDWTIGYQYYDYKENIRGLFPDLFVNQDYRVHLPYTSLRFYFGRRE